MGKVFRFSKLICFSFWQVLRDISLLYVIPDSPLHHLFREGKLSIQEVVFAYCGGIFAQHFFVRLGPDYDALKVRICYLVFCLAENLFF